MTVTSADRTVQASTLVGRLALLAGVATLALGSWAYFFPEGFFRDFPVAGAHWVSTLGEFNEHLVRDFGGAEIGLGLAAVLVASARNLVGIRSVMVGFVVFGTLHLGYHFTTFDHFHTESAVAQGVALTTFIAIPLLVLALAGRRERN